MLLAFIELVYRAIMGDSLHIKQCYRNKISANSPACTMPPSNATKEY